MVVKLEVMEVLVEEHLIGEAIQQYLEDLLLQDKDIMEDLQQ
jgi:hypothetical protein